MYCETELSDSDAPWACLKCLGLVSVTFRCDCSSSSHFRAKLGCPCLRNWDGTSYDMSCFECGEERLYANKRRDRELHLTHRAVQNLIESATAKVPPPRFPHTIAHRL